MIIFCRTLVIETYLWARCDDDLTKNICDRLLLNGNYWRAAAANEALLTAKSSYLTLQLHDVAVA